MYANTYKQFKINTILSTKHDELLTVIDRTKKTREFIVCSETEYNVSWNNNNLINKIMQFVIILINYLIIKV